MGMERIITLGLKERTTGFAKQNTLEMTCTALQRQGNIPK
jgi:hypothetical protein